MTTTRRRLAVVTTSTLALLAGATGSAWAGTSISAGCTNADDTYTSSTDEEVTLTYPHADKAMTVDPGAETAAGSLTTTTPLGGSEDCGIRGGFTDEIVVRAEPTSGLADGDVVVITAAMRFDGSVTVGGSGTQYNALAEVAAGFTVEGEQATGEAADIRAASDVDLSMQNSAYPGTALYAPWVQSWDHVGGGDPLGSYARGEGGSSRALDTGWQTVTFTAAVGERLHVDLDLDLFAASSDAATATADVDQFTVNLTGAPGVILDRGDTSPEPEPEPVPATALELVQQARALLAGYELHPGVEHALDVKLAAAEQALLAGDDACDSLASFSAQLSAQTGKKVTAEQAAALQSLVDQTEALLGC